MSPRVVISAVESGSGKTVVSIGIMGALLRKGFKVQGFKVGPDYIDSSFHEKITGRFGRNLDSYLLEEDMIKFLYNKNSKDIDISVVEGVMGLYDGLASTSFGSTAHMAKILKAPVILILNIRGMSLSAAAVVKGFMEFDRDICIKGIILNRLKSKTSFSFFKNIIEENTGIKVIGFLEDLEYLNINIKSRHLGLLAPHEIKAFDTIMEKLFDYISENIDLEFILQVSRECEKLYSKNMFPIYYKDKFHGIKIAVPYDKAFNFYYRDNLELMEYMGCQILYFDTFFDSLPKDISGIYIGGGYPEVYAKELSQNKKLLNQIRIEAENGMTIYAECGGLMYLMESIEGYNVCACIEGKTYMGSSLKHFGYVNVNIEKDCILGKNGLNFKAHEFHYSYEETKQRGIFDVSKNNGSNWRTGYTYKNVLASYTHIHFCTEPKIVVNFIKSCLGVV